MASVAFGVCPDCTSVRVPGRNACLWGIIRSVENPRFVGAAVISGPLTSVPTRLLSRKFSPGIPRFAGLSRSRFVTVRRLAIVAFRRNRRGTSSWHKALDTRLNPGFAVVENPPA